VLAALERAARGGAALIVLPEGTVPAYVLGEEPVDEAQLDAARKQVGRVARAFGTTIVYGTARASGGRTFNSATVIGPDGSELGFADKQFLWHFDRRWFARGETLEPVDTPVGRLGVLVCADGRLPTIARTLVERGAEMLVMPTAWVTSGREPAAFENAQADLMINVRARENGVPFLAANKCGVERGAVAYCGKSAIVARDGTFVARAPEGEPGVVAGQIEVGLPPREYEAAPLLELPVGRKKGTARFAFTSARDARSLQRFADVARLADADAVLSPETVGPATGVTRLGGVAAAVVDDGVFENPAGLVPARRAGVALLMWRSAKRDANATALARTRATELRGYVVVLPDEPEGRALAIDPDGVIVAGTFGAFRLAAFAYDANRTAATKVAPHTDVLEGLRAVELLREGATAEVLLG
jgi:predicted amidohydrolase